jgi:hypothetical protein
MVIEMVLPIEEGEELLRHVRVAEAVDKVSAEGMCALTNSAKGGRVYDRRMPERRRPRPPSPTEADLDEPISLWPMEAEEVLRKLLQESDDESPKGDEKES